jgi:RNA polymerase sigma-70 factor (ECF subfamily)
MNNVFKTNKKGCKYPSIFLDEKEFKKLKNRDTKAFEKLYKKYKIQIYNYLYIKTNGNIDVTKEVLCDTFYFAWVAITNLNNRKNIQGWLVTIANRRLADHLRKQYRGRNKKQYLMQDESDIDELAEQLHNKKQILIVNMALGNIKQKYKNILELKYFYNKSLKDISIILNKSESSITSKLHRARQSLRKELVKTEGFFLNEI